MGSPTAAPRESHPPASRWALPITCDALNARTVAIGEYLAFCVSSPMRCQAHFAVRVESLTSQKVTAHPPSGSAQKGCICPPLCCAGVVCRAFFVKGLPQRVERETPSAFGFYTGSTLKAVTMLTRSFASSWSRMDSSTQRNSFPYVSFTGRVDRTRI